MRKSSAFTCFDFRFALKIGKKILNNLDMHATGRGFLEGQVFCGHCFISRSSSFDIQWKNNKSKNSH